MSTRLFQALAWLVVAGIVVQIYLAGAALFGAVTFQPHRALGTGLAVAILLLLVMALIARPGRRALALTAVLLALTIVQVLLPSLRTGLPWVAALHVINAIAVGGVASSVARAAGQRTTAGDSRNVPVLTERKAGSAFSD